MTDFLAVETELRMILALCLQRCREDDLTATLTAQEIVDTIKERFGVDIANVIRENRKR